MRRFQGITIRKRRSGGRFLAWRLLATVRLVVTYPLGLGDVNRNGVNRVLGPVSLVLPSTDRILPMKGLGAFRKMARPGTVKTIVVPRPGRLFTTSDAPIRCARSRIEDHRRDRIAAPELRRKITLACFQNRPLKQQGRAGDGDRSCSRVQLSSSFACLSARG